MIEGGCWWRANEIVMRQLTRRLETCFPCRDTAARAHVHDPMTMLLRENAIQDALGRRAWPIWGHRGICSKSYAKDLARARVSSAGEQGSDAGASDVELSGDGRFAQSLAGEASDFLCLPHDFRGAAVRAAFFAGLSDTCFHSIA